MRFISLETLTTGVLSFECAFNVRWSSLVHNVRFVAFLETLSCNQSLRFRYEGAYYILRFSAIIEPS